MDRMQKSGAASFFVTTPVAVMLLLLMTIFTGAESNAQPTRVGGGGGGRAGGGDSGGRVYGAGGESRRGGDSGNGVRRIESRRTYDDDSSRGVYQNKDGVIIRDERPRLDAEARPYRRYNDSRYYDDDFYRPRHYYYDNYDYYDYIPYMYLVPPETYDVRASEQDDNLVWVEGHYEWIPQEDVIEGEFVEVFRPAIYRQKENGELELLEEERTTRESKIRLILVRDWVEGRYLPREMLPPRPAEQGDTPSSSSDAD